MSDARQKALDLIKANPANHERFFQQLEGSKWLPELVEEGFFRQPPDREEDEGWVRFPVWAESQYLIQVAAQEPELVAKTAAAIPETNNVRVHEDILKIAAQVPGSAGAQLADKEARFLAKYRGPTLALADASDSLINHLVQEGQLDSAFHLLEAILRVEANPSSEAPTRQRAVGFIDTWQYGRTVKKTLPRLLKADPARAFKFICDRLEEAIHFGFAGEPGYASGSGWRSAIEDHGQNLGRSLFDTLVERVRDAAVELADSGQMDLAMLTLAKHNQEVFARISLHLLRQHGDNDQILDALLAHTQGYTGYIWHEYSMLLRETFASLNSEQRQSVVEEISKGPGLDAQDDEAERRLYWRYRRFGLIAAHLEGSTYSEYEQLRNRFGEIPHETFVSYSRSWMGPTSPYSDTDLSEMGPEGVVEAVRAWKPPDAIEAPTPEGLGRIVETVVAEQASQYATAASLFMGLDATYIRALLGGLSKAAKEGNEFDWKAVMEVCEWVIEQPRLAEDLDRDVDQDPHWGWARKQVADLLDNGLTKGKGEIPLLLRERIWALLEQLTNDPDPAPERESYGEHSMDPATLAINTVRGEAIHAIFRYLLWVERGLGNDFSGTESVPEVVELLDRHLDLEVDPSWAIRAVYGQWFPQLVRIEQEWADRLTPAIFPLEADQGELFDAAWDAYVAFNDPYRDVLHVLREAYGRAIERIPIARRAVSFAGDPVELLGDQLLFFVAFGDLDLDDEGLFVRYWGVADNEAKKHVISQLGWSLEHRAESLPDEVVDRLQGAWAWIVEDADETAPYLAAFGAWLGTKLINGAWLLSAAREVLERGIHLDPNFVVFGAMPRLANERPEEAVEVIRLMAETDPEGWSITGSEDEIRQTLATALGAGGEASDRARAVIDFLGASGMTSFGALLES